MRFREWGKNENISYRLYEVFLDFAVLHIMYNTGEKMTTSLASEITNRSRNFASKLLKNLSYSTKIIHI